MTVGDEFGCIALGDEAERLETVDRQMRERVVDHQMPDVGGGDACFRERRPAGQLHRLGLGEVSHLRDHGRFRGLPGAEDVYDRLGEVGRPVGRSHDQRAAAVGNQAAFEQVEGVSDQARGQHVVDCDRIAEHRARILGRPPTLGDGDVGELLVRQPVVLHVPEHRNREHGRRPGDAVGQLELTLRGRRREREPAGADSRPPRLTVRDQHRARLPGGDGRRRVPDV